MPSVLRLFVVFFSYAAVVLLKERICLSESEGVINTGIVFSLLSP